LVQVQNAQDAGFQAVIVFDNLDESLVDMGGSGGLLESIAFSVYTRLMNLIFTSHRQHHHPRCLHFNG
jgi:hypothetical protein